MATKLEFRGISQEMIIHYISAIAEKNQADIIINDDQSVRVDGDNWQALISKEEMFYYSPSLYFPRLFISFYGDEIRVEQALKKLRSRTLRMGG